MCAYTVYKHTSPSGKVYIGITSQSTSKRWLNGQGYIHNEYFYRAIQKYGWENITHEILARGLTSEEAKQMEIDLIVKYRSNNRSYGYNITIGGDGVHGYKHSDERKAKIRNKFEKGHLPWNTGKQWSDEAKRKMSESHKGKPSPMKGKRLSEERRKFNSLIRKIPVSQFDKSGNLIKHWDSGKDAAVELSISHGNINECCRGNRKTAGGYVWRYRKDEN